MPPAAALAGLCRRLPGDVAGAAAAVAPQGNAPAVALRVQLEARARGAGSAAAGLATGFWLHGEHLYASGQCFALMGVTAFP